MARPCRSEGNLWVLSYHEISGTELRVSGFVASAFIYVMTLNIEKENRA